MPPALRLESDAIPLRRRLRNFPPLLRRRRSGSLAGGAVCLAVGFRLRRFRPSALQRSALPPRRGQIFQPLEPHADPNAVREAPPLVGGAVTDGSVNFPILGKSQIGNRKSSMSCPP
jgi:hypothetical protein